MGVFLIFASVLVVAIVSTVFICLGTEQRAYTIKYVQRENSYFTDRVAELKSRFWKFWYDINNGISTIITGILIAVCSIAVIVMSIFSIVVCARRNVAYEQMQYKYIILTERLEEDNNNYHLFYEDICNYNNAILEDRYWADNLWVNWYHNGKIKDLPLIGE